MRHPIAPHLISHPEPRVRASAAYAIWEWCSNQWSRVRRGGIWLDVKCASVSTGKRPHPTATLRASYGRGASLLRVTFGSRRWERGVAVLEIGCAWVP